MLQTSPLLDDVLNDGCDGPFSFARALEKWTLRQNALRAGTQGLAAMEQTSRRMLDLARELGCLGHFESDGAHRPRAA